MEGTATNEGKNYAIKTDFGTIHVPITNVEYVGQDKFDIYRYKKSFVDGANCNDLMKFAEWCLGLGLEKEGIEEYERALKVAPNSALSDVIRDRLKTIAERKETEDDSGNPPLMGSAAPERGRNESELNRWIAGVPKPVVDHYVKKVQPVLLSGCAAADCHGTNSSNKFQMAKPRQTLGATTYGNLQAVLPWINLDYPTDSPLLKAMVTYHGGTKPLHSVESRQYINVIQWIQLAAKELPIEYHQQYHQRLREPEGNREPEKMKLATDSGTPLLPKNTTLLPPGFHDLIATGQEMNASVATVKVPSDKEKVEEKLPEDPFDPEVFNARYHGLKKRP